MFIPVTGGWTYLGALLTNLTHIDLPGPWPASLRQAVRSA
jgi:hypothetical protein